MDIKDLPLDKRVAAAVYATQEEKFELLQEIAKDMKDEEKEFFWELVNIVKQSIEKK